MSIFGAMFSGVTGLQAQSQFLGMISDNISNVNTIGYKGSISRFSTLVTEAASATTFTPGGVQSNTTQMIDKQGLLQASTSKSDIAIIGKGMFVVNESSAPGIGDEFLYTRAGSFTPDESGFLKNSSGFYLMGWPTDSTGTITVANPSVLSSLQTINISGVAGSATPTTSIDMGANLPATATVGTSHSLSVDIFDSLGVQHTQSFTFTKTAANAWSIAPTPPAGAGQVTLTNTASQVYASAGHLEFASVPADGDTITVAGTTFEFDTGGGVGGGNVAVDISAVAGSTVAVATALKAAIDGVPLAEAARFTANASSLRMTQSATGAAIAVDASGTSAITQSSIGAFSIPALTTAAAGLTFDGNGLPATINVANMSAVWSNGATATASTLDLGTVGQADGMTQYASSFTTYFINQNGVRFGTFNGVSIDELGTVTALFDNGQTSPLYKVPIATFNNMNGLETISGNVFRETDKSGNVLLIQAGSGPVGRISPSALEASNVDVATEFTSMIITQQAYSAAARIITTADEMLDEILRIAR